MANNYYWLFLISRARLSHLFNYILFTFLRIKICKMFNFTKFSFISIKFPNVRVFNIYICWLTKSWPSMNKNNNKSTWIQSIPWVISNRPVPILIPRVEPQRIITQPPAQIGAVDPVPKLIIPSRDPLTALM